MKHLSTSDLARAVGIHPNTVRLYEDWGLIPPVERSPSGYRQFTRLHLDCLRLARLIYSADYPGRTLRAVGKGVIERAVANDWQGALEEMQRYEELVRSELEHANRAVTVLEAWVQKQPDKMPDARLSIGGVSKLLGVSVDVIRNWERNGLYQAPRSEHNGYRAFGQAEIERLRIIRMLSRAGYSHMAMLRMFIELDGGNAHDLRQALDTPRADEDVFMASDRWLTTLHKQEELARQAVALIREAAAARQGTG